jgi:transposase
MKRTRPLNGVTRRYSWRLYPTVEQEAELRQHAVMCGELWNALLETCELLYSVRVWVFQKDAGGPLLFNEAGNLHALKLSDVLLRRRFWRPLSVHEVLRSRSSQINPDKLDIRTYQPSEFDMGYWVSGLLSDCPEWRALSTWTPRRVVTSLKAAYLAFFRNPAGGRPRYKNVRKHLSVPHRCISGCRIRKSDRHERSWEIRLKGITGSIWARGMLPKPDIVHEWLDADIMYRDGHWEASIATDIESRRHSGGNQNLEIRFGVIGGLASINGELDTPQYDAANLSFAHDLEIVLDRKKSEFDLRWPRGKRCDSVEEAQERRDEREEISRLSGRVARIRRNALHVWTSRIIRRAESISIICPAISEHVETPRGDASNWGANVETVSHLNRKTLSFAPAMARAMLEYKAKEAGIKCIVIEDEASDLTVGRKLVAAGKSLRKAKRAIRRKYNERH